MLKNSCMEDTKFLVPSVRVTIAKINKKKKIKECNFKLSDTVQDIIYILNFSLNFISTLRNSFHYF